MVIKTNRSTTFTGRECSGLAKGMAVKVSARKDNTALVAIQVLVRK